MIKIRFLVKIASKFKKQNNHFRNSVYCFLLRHNIRNFNFTIISNNCWGGGIYQDLNIPYLTPTVGLFFYATDYIRFVSNLQYYFNIDLKFVDKSKYDEVNRVRINNFYPIGVLDDVEIQFIHYHSEEEAFEKWNKRKKRVNYENLFLKFCDRDMCTKELMIEFDKIKGAKNKVIFSSNNFSDINSLVYLRDFEGQDSIGDIYTNKECYRKVFNVAKWLNV